MSSPEECICSIALTQIPGIGHIWAKKLLDGVGNAVDVFRYRKELPDRLPGVNSRVVEALDCPQALSRATQEFEFAEKNHISCLAFTDERYPSRLRECDDAPVVLFFKGAADLNSLRVINMVGTRNATDYGKQALLTVLTFMPIALLWPMIFLRSEYWHTVSTVFILLSIGRRLLICCKKAVF